MDQRQVVNQIRPLTAVLRLRSGQVRCPPQNQSKLSNSLDVDALQGTPHP